ncbi:hypothetical protein HK405_015857, partial [Cladochytrium tenue]
MVASLRHEQEEERLRMDHDRRNLEEQIAAAQSERDLARERLRLERLDMVRQHEAWALERRKAERQTSDDQRRLAMEGAELEARRGAIAEVEAETARLRQRDEAQTIADRSVLENDLHALAARRAELERESAGQRAARLALDADRARLAAEDAELRQAWDRARAGLREAAALHHDAAQDRRAAEAIHAKAMAQMALFDGERADIRRLKKE